MADAKSFDNSKISRKRQRKKKARVCLELVVNILNNNLEYKREGQDRVKRDRNIAAMIERVIESDRAARD